ncbi:MAG: 3-deoxy-manno-octulosonate cytidylyltransferase [Phaeodactylibacter sp.]|nr:3-deoxy-manno-octulosonate cytidylyltransferase [Phaeodactylibacter sp.]MCB9303388.1 3-deoxy-manno-octulosonate cytidylyltransferase [Lewinellaceae bacterium]HQU60787.1 3-deoxy-manno-octulosonate cytidylyltransferase [Saprospiraceae bacterium]
MKTVGIIPARFASTRFPGKPLAEIGGKTVVQRVYEQASRARRLDQVIVATDDERIFQHVESFGGQVMMTRPEHQSGTDRCAEVAWRIDEADAIINIQGDEPFIAPEQIDLVAEPLARRQGVQISTLARRISLEEELHNPNIVKVVFNRQQMALYFSRSTIPYLRGVPTEQWLSAGVFYKHIGLYGFRREVLMDVTRMEQSRYEQLESLEQLRWLEAGINIFVNITETETIGIDTPEDLERARAWL